MFKGGLVVVKSTQTIYHTFSDIRRYLSFKMRTFSYMFIQSSSSQEDKYRLKLATTIQPSYILLVHDITKAKSWYIRRREWNKTIFKFKRFAEIKLSLENFTQSISPHRNYMYTQKMQLQYGFHVEMFIWNIAAAYKFL